MKIETYIRSVGTQGTLVDSANLPAAAIPPTLCLGMNASLMLHFFDGDSAAQMTAEDFAAIGAWRLSLDEDYNQATDPILRYTDGITVAEDGTVVVVIPNVSSTKLVSSLGVKESGEYIAELAGYAAGEPAPSFLVQFPVNIFNRIDLEGGSESIPVSSGYYTNSQVDALLASAYEFQFSADGESWHNTQVGTDRWFRIKNGSVSGAQWSDPIAIPAGAPGQDGEDGDDGVSTYIYVGYASDSAGADFSLTPTDSLKYRAEIHVSSAIAEPASSDFASATWVKYLGDNGSSTVTWGGIAGTLADQADLASAFSSKQDAITDNNKLPYSRVSGGPDVGSGNLIFTSGGTQVATYNAQTDSDVTVPLPAGGGGGVDIHTSYPSNPAAGELYITEHNLARYYFTSTSFAEWGIAMASIPVYSVGNMAIYETSQHPVHAKYNSVIISSGAAAPGNGLYWTYPTGNLFGKWADSNSSAYGEDLPFMNWARFIPCDSVAFVYSSGYMTSDQKAVVAKYDSSCWAVIYEDAGGYLQVMSGPSLAEWPDDPLGGQTHYDYVDSGGIYHYTLSREAEDIELYARANHTHSVSVTAIPASSAAYPLSDGAFTHVPDAATAYTLPAVSGNAVVHEVSVEVEFPAWLRNSAADVASTYAWKRGSQTWFTSTATPTSGDTLYLFNGFTLVSSATIAQYDSATGAVGTVDSCTYKDAAGHTIAPLSTPIVVPGAVVTYLCRWMNTASRWSIMPVVLQSAAIPEITISGSPLTVSGTVSSAITSVDLSSNTVLLGAGAVAYAVASGTLPAGVTLSSGVLAGTPTSAGSASVAIEVSCGEATPKTIAVDFDIAESSGGGGGGTGTWTMIELYSGGALNDHPNCLGSYTETSAGHYENASGYYVEAQENFWRLFASDDSAVATGPAADSGPAGEYQFDGTGVTVFSSGN